jgi:endo-1,4-beta-D-glucanase Y
MADLTRRSLIRTHLTGAAFVAALAVASSGCGGGSGASPSATARSTSPAASATAAATAFLDAYVRADGRVVRTDQGGDTVSEGQAYGLVLAQAAGEDATFAKIWQWTRTHLQRGDGLLSYHADASGRVLDPQPASDADLLIAWTLLRATGPDAAALHADGRRVAAAVLAEETTRAPDGGLLLTAGPWATGRPATLNPSYWALPVLRDLGSLTADRRWDDMAAAAVSSTSQITDGGRLLPPDWAALPASGAARPEPSPNGGQGQPQYGLDAQRTVVWFAADCDQRARVLAAAWWSLLKDPARQRPIALGLQGAVINAAAAPLPYVAAAAAARAAGDQTASTSLLEQAAAQQRMSPTYYGGAWSALGPMYIGRASGGC